MGKKSLGREGPLSLASGDKPRKLHASRLFKYSIDLIVKRCNIKNVTAYTDKHIKNHIKELLQWIPSTGR